MNIVLIGMRGSGKTTVGRLLAERLGYGFVDTDEVAAEKTGRSIADIVAQAGWERFRDLESEVIEEVGKREDHVIACGGGAVLREGNIKALRQNGIIVWLHAPVEVLAGRIRSDENATRPPLTAETTLEMELSTLLLDREPRYRAAAQITLSAGDKIPDDIVKEIIVHLKHHED